MDSTVEDSTSSNISIAAKRISSVHLNGSDLPPKKRWFINENNSILPMCSSDGSGWKRQKSTHNWDLNICAQSQRPRKDNFWGVSETEKAHLIDVGVEAEEVKEDNSSENLIDQNVNVAVGAKNGLEEDNEQTLPNSKGLTMIPKMTEDDCINPRLRDETQSETLQNNRNSGVYVGMQDDDDDDDDEVEDDNGQRQAGDDDISNIWNEMRVALEYCEDSDVDGSNEGSPVDGSVEDVEGYCDHSFILKDDIGYVCCFCGLIEKPIEAIIEYKYANKVKMSGRTYQHEASSKKYLEQTKILPGREKLAGSDYSASELISIHPRHRKVIKPHQIDGFDFLLSNLECDDPGGCIMAHAPGSGKTFMIISFLQSFMAKYPASRPLIVLPRGILSTWKTEFQKWQVEDIPLYDFYSSKADSRSQQLEILHHWMNERSILFLSYKQFSVIVCQTDNGEIARECKKILLTCPSILILDEGHTPRNQDTDILKSLEKVQTPRKVVLSGTLYQNHVAEVFNILNLVRPRFLYLDASKFIKYRILSRVQMPGKGKKASSVRFSSNDFYEIVEYTLLKDECFNRKMSVIRDLREMTSNVLHYYKGESLDELPGLVDFTIYLELSATQREEVKELMKIKNRFKRESYGSSIYLHPHLKKKDEDIEYEKIDVSEGVKVKFYLNLLRLCESTGEKLLVFSRYLLPLKFLERLTTKVMNYSVGKEIFTITGNSDSNLRDLYMKQFNNSSTARVLFGSIKACGEGISLIGASRIIVLDVHLNPSVTRQAIGRAFRPGQVRKVYVYRLVAYDSPEVDDHLICFRKETISKIWFEWNMRSLGPCDFEMETVNLNDSGDMFLETPRLSKDVVSVFRR